MRISQMVFSTLREDPADAEIASHRLLYRAGMIRKAAGGIYTYMPMAVRILRKISQIVREEMDRQGGLELQMPLIQPADPWKETGRWAEYGAEMFKLRDRHEREFCLAPTHEEMVTTLVRSEIRSYKQLPVMFYQVANKYRDEVRPRFGLMRGREFVMKDLYSFDADEIGLDVSYAKMRDAYCRIFSRCGLQFRAVEADPGLIGEKDSHEFMVMADSGEAKVAYCTECDYAANTERAECSPGEVGSVEGCPSADFGPMEVNTPGAKSIEQVSALLGCSPTALIKTLLFTDGTSVVAALVRGDADINEVKLSRVLGGAELQLAPEHLVERVTGAPVGFAGPVGLSSEVKVVADLSVFTVSRAVVGANKAETHLTNVSPGMDFRADVVADIRTAKAGDLCPRCRRGQMRFARGIEVGHIFKLGTKYSTPLRATYLDQSGQEKPLVMGCYGVGISRTLAAAVEQHHDANGIIWPFAIAPYHTVVIPVSVKDEEQMAVAKAIYSELQRLGVEVVLDDRDERPGVKFKDADLVGFPVRVTVGPKALAEGQVELKLRRDEASSKVAIAHAASAVLDAISTLRTD